ncbi:MAG: ROK family protein, partial [Micromonospora sp.]
MAAVTLTIGVDVGGTKVAGGVVDDTGKVLVQARRDTPADDVAKTRDVIIELVTELAVGRDIAAVGIGAAGWIDATRSTVLFAPNLAWRDEPLREYVSNATGLPVIVENDGNVAAWAEFRYGAARDADDSMVMFTIGT